ncbi:MAG: hypothetical protein AT711_07840 [Thermoproteus sp. CIS_19]|jgi:Methylase involved in ubiquinone/menaquinone biosynthesis|nr:MAG: hypothetical protein AT711_07840 [Thermoproteus sp. CIS_19]
MEDFYFERFDERGAAFYELLVKLHVFDWAYSATAKLVEAAVDRGSRLLEVGPGVGKLAGLLERRGYRVVGVDVSPAMLRRARRRTSADLVAGASWARRCGPARLTGRWPSSRSTTGAPTGSRPRGLRGP